MEITLKEWREIESKCQMARKALNEFQQSLRMTATNHFDSKEEVELLCGLADKVDEISFISPYMFKPQEEWKGGDSLNPDNFFYREPHICPTNRHFTRDEELDCLTSDELLQKCVALGHDVASVAGWPDFRRKNTIKENCH